MACNVPPAGWYCTRTAGHDGPCAAIPTSDYRTYVISQLQAAMMKEAEGIFASAVEHEMAAIVALKLQRIPTYAEIVKEWEHSIIEMPHP